jgi:hypothetical protein
MINSQRHEKNKKGPKKIEQAAMTSMAIYKIPWYTWRRGGPGEKKPYKSGICSICDWIQ